MKRFYANSDYGSAGNFSELCGVELVKAEKVVCFGTALEIIGGCVLFIFGNGLTP